MQAFRRETMVAEKTEAIKWSVVLDFVRWENSLKTVLWGLKILIVFIDLMEENQIY